MVNNVDRAINYLHDMKPLIDRADTIQNQEIRQLTTQMILHTPIDNWRKKASRAHHLPDERGEWGTRLHTCRVFDCFVFISSVFKNHESYIDIGKSASLLHDCRKYGINGTYDYTVDEHPFLVRRVMDELEIPNTVINFREPILTCVEAHMGQWTEKNGKKAPVDFDSLGPLKDLAKMVHLSDCIVARFAEVMGFEPLAKD